MVYGVGIQRRQGFVTVATTTVDDYVPTQRFPSEEQGPRNGTQLNLVDNIMYYGDDNDSSLRIIFGTPFHSSHSEYSYLSPTE